MFQNALIESGKPASASRRRPLPVGIALAVHGGVAALLVGSSLWSVGEAPEPAIHIEFHLPLATPPLGDGSAARRETAAARRVAAAPNILAAPVRISDPTEHVANVASHAVEVNADPVGPGDEIGTGTGGDPRGSPDGPPWGTSTLPGDPAGDTAEALPVGGKVLAPLLVLRVDPAYPESMRRVGVQGTVVLEAIISASGVVEDVRVVKSINSILDAAAVKAVEGWRYKAATLNGRAVKVWLNVTVTFSLH